MTEKEERLKADPSIAVYDLETAIQKYFDAMGERDFQLVLERIKLHSANWSSAPKALPASPLHPIALNSKCVWHVYLGIFCS